MKYRLFQSLGLALVLLLPAMAGAQTADQLVARGREHLCQSNLVAARNEFTAALVRDPNHPTANALAGAVRLMLLPQRPAVSNLLTRMGVDRAGRDPYRWTADVARDTDGNWTLPATVNSSELNTVIRNEVLPAVLAAQAHLARITNAAYRLDVDDCEVAAQGVTVDAGDILLLRSMLHGAEFLIYTMNAHNSSVVINRLLQLSHQDELSLQRLLADYPALLNKASAPDLALSRSAFTNGLQRYLAASEFIRDPARRPAGEQRLFTLEDDETAEEGRFRDLAVQLLASLDAPVQLQPDHDHYVFGGSYFAGTKSVRSLTPRFERDAYVPNSMPDPTLNGLFVGLAPDRVERFLQQHFPSDDPAGLYLGQSDSGGLVAILIRPNGQATIIASSGIEGFSDDGFDVSADGNWNRDLDGWSHRGSVSEDGEFWGEVDRNGQWADSFWGSRVPADGRYAREAGYYSGRRSGFSGAGPVRAILTPEGQLVFAALSNSGEFRYGGNGEFDDDDGLYTDSSNGNYFDCFLKRTPMVIDGVFINAENGFRDSEFVLRRTGFLPTVTPATPPQITRQPPPLDVVAGATAVLKVTATGTAPLVYQWWYDGLPIWGATAATLTMPRVDPSWAGRYQVVVGNGVGSITSAPALMTVRPETVVPQIRVSMPVRNGRVLADGPAVIVGGTATDNVRVVQVRCALNGGPWVDADGTEAWSARLAMQPGTNVLRCYAVDSSANRSATGSVAFVWILAQPVTLETRIDGIPGGGRFTGVTNGQWLELGRTMTVTAIPYASNLFAGWGEERLPRAAVWSFEMRSNLVLTAHFVPNPFPAVRGDYRGLFLPSSSVRPTNAGHFSLNLTDQGVFSGRLQFAGGAVPFSGQFDPTRFARVTIPRAGQPPWQMELQLEPDGGASRITGHVAGAGWTASVSSDRAGQYVGATAGRRYTLLVPGTPDDLTLPPGAGALTALVGRTGGITLGGKLADGTVCNQVDSLSKSGRQPLFIALYGGKGMLIGWVTYEAGGRVRGEHVTWVKPAKPGDRYYPAGFSGHPDLNGALYQAPLSGLNALAWTNGVVRLTEGNLGAPVVHPVRILRNGVTITNSPQKLTLTINPAQGTFTGSFLQGRVTVPLNGVLVPADGVGGGWFLGTNRGGYISISPANP